MGQDLPTLKIQVNHKWTPKKNTRKVTGYTHQASSSILFFFFAYFTLGLPSQKWQLTHLSFHLKQLPHFSLKNQPTFKLFFLQIFSNPCLFFSMAFYSQSLNQLQLVLGKWTAAIGWSRQLQVDVGLLTRERGWQHGRRKREVMGKWECKR